MTSDIHGKQSPQALVEHLRQCNDGEILNILCTALFHMRHELESLKTSLGMYDTPDDDKGSKGRKR